jgi:hypothetical protein
VEHKPSYSDTLRADIQPSYRDSLTHHGILGMHWGVRRFQNSDGSYTSAGKKRLSKKQERQERNRKSNDEVEYMLEYDETPQGKQKLKAYSKEIDIMENDPKWSDSVENMKRFDKAERDYLYNQGVYVAKKMAQKYGEKDFTDYYESGGASAYGVTTHDGKNIYDRYAKTHMSAHSY